MKFLLWTSFALLGFISGSVMYSAIIPKIFCRKDVGELSDDKNPGATNVFKHCGKFIGSLCLALDIVKGAVPVLLAVIFAGAENLTFAAVMLAPVAGHALGAFNKFRGGKCIATSFGVTLGLLPTSVIAFALLAFYYIVFSSVFNIKPHKKRSIVVFFTFAVSALAAYIILHRIALAVGSVAIALVVILKHSVVKK